MTPGRRFSGSVSNVFTYGGNLYALAWGIAGDGGRTKDCCLPFGRFSSAASPPIAGRSPLFGLGLGEAQYGP